MPGTKMHIIKTAQKVLPFIIVLLFASFTSSKREERIVNDFRLKSTDGKVVSLADYKDAKGFIIVFTCNHCPFAKLYPQRLVQLNNEYLPKNIPLIAISSTDTVVFDEDVYVEMQKTARVNNFNFPYLQDDMQTVARQFRAEKTPHAFVIWKEGDRWVVKYNGAVDDNGGEADQVKHRYVAEAVDALLKGEQIVIPETKSIGCAIKWRK